MLKHALWAMSCLVIGLVTGTLIAGVIDTKLPAPEGPAAPETIAEEQLASEAAAEPALTSEQDWIIGEARTLIHEFMRRPEGGPWRAAYSVEDHFVVNADQGRWVTVSAARLPCSEVDGWLAQQDDTELGLPDTCRRWRRAAADAMTHHGIRGRTPEVFLDELGADRSARVMLVYAGWARDPNRDGEIRLVDARAASVYPRSDFMSQRTQAQTAIFEALELGPFGSIQN